MFLDAKPGGKYSDHWAVNGLMVNWSNAVQYVCGDTNGVML